MIATLAFGALLIAANWWSLFSRRSLVPPIGGALALVVCFGLGRWWLGIALFASDPGHLVVVGACLEYLRARRGHPAPSKPGKLSRAVVVALPETPTGRRSAPRED